MDLWKKRGINSLESPTAKDIGRSLSLSAPSLSFITTRVCGQVLFSVMSVCLCICVFVCVSAGADLGGPGGQGPPLTLGFEAPKLSIFGPY